MKPISIAMLPLCAALLGAAAFAFALAPNATATPAGGPPQADPRSTNAVTTDATTRVYSKSAYDITPLSKARIAELAAKLDPEQYRVTQKSGTEAPFCGNLLDNKKEGFYACVVCDLPLFSSSHKFDSGTGWPSFYQEVDPAHVHRVEDRSHGMVRTEIECARCTAHLGHVFEDGPRPTGERHCLNSASLVFYEQGQELPDGAKPVETATAYFAGGCFWGIEHYLEMGPGVIDVVSGYMQGKVDNPTYKQVVYEDTGHAEAVKVVFDPSVITYERLLEAFFVMHDPTQLNRQGPDVGTQYRSGVYTTSDAQLKAAQKYKDELEASGKFKRPIVTEIEPAKTFWVAEDYHQDYIANTGRACHVTNPW